MSSKTLFEEYEEWREQQTLINFPDYTDWLVARLINERAELETLKAENAQLKNIIGNIRDHANPAYMNVDQQLWKLGVIYRITANYFDTHASENANIDEDIIAMGEQSLKALSPQQRRNQAVLYTLTKTEAPMDVAGLCNETDYDTVEVVAACADLIDLGLIKMVGYYVFKAVSENAPKNVCTTCGGRGKMSVWYDGFGKPCPDCSGEAETDPNPTDEN